MVFCTGRKFGANSRIVILTTCCVAGWFLGQFLAHIFPPKPIISVFKNTRTVPPLETQKCNRWSPCPNGSFVFEITSGGGQNVFPNICFEDEIILGESNAGRGINIAVVSASSGKMTDSANFNMWTGDNSGAMVKFIQGIPSGTFVMMATFDEGSKQLKPEAKKEIEKLGSTLINKINFRANWVFFGAKGVDIPGDFTKEKILFLNKKKSKSPGWPAVIQIDGCVGRK
ncbi:hypothetical protein SKAU_G00271650 [Synaphobranchus kaupii]|uniref:ILEI/PANDER domain-containing protein n=1 Tax=Synaphobranchus kaupii TaxID=118154 RepID=A0A9Q1F0H0_SYNKA|nr:hypothetical protein SKAU_G00271650 [Synaphobranchus kaupii]